MQINKYVISFWLIDWYLCVLCILQVQHFFPAKNTPPSPTAVWAQQKGIIEKDTIFNVKSMHLTSVLYPKAEIHQAVYAYEYEQEFLQTLGSHPTVQLKCIIYCCHSQNFDDMRRVCISLAFWITALAFQNQAFKLCIFCAKDCKIKPSGILFQLISPEIYFIFKNITDISRMLIGMQCPFVFVSQRKKKIRKYIQRITYVPRINKCAFCRMRKHCRICKCKGQRYCSKRCQKLHWKHHKTECNSPIIVTNSN